MDEPKNKRKREEGRGEEGRKKRGKILYFNVLQKIKRSVPLY